jgi:hypothetical protein
MVQALIDAVEEGALDPEHAGRALPSLTDLLRQPWAQIDHLEAMLWVAWMWSRGQKRNAKARFLKTEQELTGLTVTALRAMLGDADTALASFRPRSTLWHSATAPVLVLFVEPDHAAAAALATALGRAAPGRAIRTERVWADLLPRVADLLVQAGDVVLLLWSSAARAELAPLAARSMEAIQRRQGLIAVARGAGTELPDLRLLHAVVEIADIEIASADLARLLASDEAARVATGRRVVRSAPAGTGERIYVTAERFHRTVALDLDLSMPVCDVVRTAITALDLPREHVAGGVRIASYDYVLYLDERPLDGGSRLDEQGCHPGVTLDLFIDPRLFPDGPPPVQLPGGGVRNPDDVVPATEDAARRRAEMHLLRSLRSTGLAP